MKKIKLTKNGKLFLKLIDLFSKRKQHNTHYINIGNKKLMVIRWIGRWNFKIEKLEDVANIIKSKWFKCHHCGKRHYFSNEESAYNQPVDWCEWYD